MVGRVPPGAPHTSDQNQRKDGRQTPPNTAAMDVERGKPRGRHDSGFRQDLLRGVPFEPRRASLPLARCCATARRSNGQGEVPAGTNTRPIRPEAEVGLAGKCGPCRRRCLAVQRTAWPRWIETGRAARRSSDPKLPSKSAMKKTLPRSGPTVGACRATRRRRRVPETLGATSNPCIAASSRSMPGDGMCGSATESQPAAPSV